MIDFFTTFADWERRGNKYRIVHFLTVYTHFMNRFLYILGLLLLNSMSFGQNYLSDFKNVIQEVDTIKQLEILQKWEAEYPKNPDLFASYFNYYYHLSKNEMITLTMVKAKEESFELKDSSEQTSYLGNEVVYNKERWNSTWQHCLSLCS